MVRGRSRGGCSRGNAGRRPPLRAALPAARPWSRPTSGCPAARKPAKSCSTRSRSPTRG